MILIKDYSSQDFEFTVRIRRGMNDSVVVFITSKNFNNSDFIQSGVDTGKMITEKRFGMFSSKEGESTIILGGFKKDEKELIPDAIEKVYSYLEMGIEGLKNYLPTYITQNGN